MDSIRIAIAGMGNCASALLQGLAWCRSRGSSDTIGVMRRTLGGYAPEQIRLVAAFDVDARKVGRDAADAVFAPPNCARQFQHALPATGTAVRMGPVLDGVPEHMAGYPDHQRFLVADVPEPDREAVVLHLRESGADVLINYLPVGSEQASRFYAECALDAGLGFINAIPALIASDPAWANRFSHAGLPLIGDDIKSQLGATVLHRTLVELFARRGVALDRTYQLNTGGNTDFLNMLNRDRLQTKRQSKTEAVQSAAASRLPDDAIHIGPSDYVPWQHDGKVCFIRMEGRLFGNTPVNLELRLAVEDSPNSAGVMIDAIRCCRLALDRREAGVLTGPSACFCKHPPRQMTEHMAMEETDAFILRAQTDAQSRQCPAARPAPVDPMADAGGHKGR